MEIDKVLQLAAAEALRLLEIENTVVVYVGPHPAPDKYGPYEWRVQFQEDNDKHFQVIVDTAIVLTTYGSNTVDSFTQEIVKLLQQRDPNDYMD